MAEFIYEDRIYRTVEREVGHGDIVRIPYHRDIYIGEVYEVYPDLSVSVDVGDTLPFFPHAFAGEYTVLEPVEQAEPAPAEEEPATLDAEEVRLDPEKVIDMFTELSKTVAELSASNAQQQREIDRLKQLTEENAKNTLTFAEELERMKHKAEHTQNQTSHVDLVTEFLLEDIGVLAEKLGKLDAMKRRDWR